MTLCQVEQDCYHGPLDLLVCLVRMNEVDILDVAISVIAQAYFDALEVLSTAVMEAAGEFLVQITLLMEYKSRALIPTPSDPVQEQEQENRRDLVKQLLEYKRFKEAAALLWEKARKHQLRMARAVDDLPVTPKDPATQPIRELELWDLVSAFSRLMKESIVPVTDRIPRDPTPIGVYMDRLEAIVLQAGEVTFRQLIGEGNTKPQLIGKFLALLELIKRRRVWVEPGSDPDSILVSPPRELPTLEQTSSMPMEDESVPPDALPHAEAADAGDADGAWDDADSSPPDAGNSSSAWDDFEPILDPE